MKSAARRSLLIATAAMSALALGACSAGQVTQTSSQVAAINGVATTTEDKGLELRDVTLLVNEENGQAHLKLTASNNDPAKRTYTLSGVSVDGAPVALNPEVTAPIAPTGSLVTDSREGLDAVPQEGASGLTTYATLPVANPGFAFGGAVPVTLTFSNSAGGATSAALDVPVAAPQLVSGDFHREAVDSAHAH